MAFTQKAIWWSAVWPWLAPLHCVVAVQLLQILVRDCGSENLGVPGQCLVLLALCIGGRSCAEGLVFWNIKYIVLDASHLCESAVLLCFKFQPWCVMWKHTKQRNKKLPFKYSTSKMTSTSHENDPRSLLCYSFQRGSCIVFVIQLKLFRKNDKILNYINLKCFFFFKQIIDFIGLILTFPLSMQR